jgi:hypothetical protein
MNPLPHQTSNYEQQLALAILAHATRHDDHALTVLLNLLAEPSAGLCPVCVIAALIAEFQRGMDTNDSAAVARQFSNQALALAADESAQ